MLITSAGYDALTRRMSAKGARAGSAKGGGGRHHGRAGGRQQGGEGEEEAFARKLAPWVSRAYCAELMASPAHRARSRPAESGPIPAVESGGARSSAPETNDEEYLSEDR